MGIRLFGDRTDLLNPNNARTVLSDPSRGYSQCLQPSFRCSIYSANAGRGEAVPAPRSQTRSPGPRLRSKARSAGRSPFPDFSRKRPCVTSDLSLAAILRPRVCAFILSWSAQDLLSANPSPPRGPVSSPTRYKKAVDAGVGGGRERGREVPGRSETGRDRAEERKAMRRTGAPTQADSRGRGRARGGCPGGEATPSFPPPRGGTRGQEPQVPRGLRRVAGQALARPRPRRGRGGGC